MHQCFRFFARVGAAGLVFLSPLRALGASDLPSRVVEPSIRTVAGNGVPGMANGTASGPVFLMPVAIAVARDRSLIVVDQAAQRIRRVDRGTIKTIAGSGADDGGFGQVDGGYRDGAALQAQFNEPSGVAIAGDGAIYVADQLNHCIRKIQGGVVSTLAGAPDRTGNADGPIAMATFLRPTAIAVADDGTLFVTDFGNGLREITKAGVVSTLKLPDSGDNRFTGVAVSGTGADMTVAVVGLSSLYYSVKPAAPETAQVLNGSEGGAFPTLFGIAAADESHFFATDLTQNAIREIRYPDKPLVTQPEERIVAGAPVVEAADSGGFEDGPFGKAKFYSPLGIAISGRTLFICDAGNRRIREMPLPDVRGPVGSNLQELQSDPSTYRIATIGASHSFWATDWETSIPGLLEAGLNKARTQLDIPRRVRVSEIRIDAAGLGQQADYLTNEVADGQVNLVVMLLRVGDLTNVTANPGEDRVAASVRVLKALRAKLKAAGTELFVNVRADAFAATQVDDISDREVTGDLVSSYRRYQEKKAEELAILSGAGVPFGLDLDDYVAYNKRPVRLPLWPYRDSHENLNGRIFAADNVLRELEAQHPWTASPSKR